MRITYDTEVDALTIVVTREDVARTVDVGKGRFLDLDEDGNLVALEILDVSAGIELRDLVDQYDLRPLLEQLICALLLGESDGLVRPTAPLKYR